MDNVTVECQEIGAIILAAGFSSRMGAFKPLLPIGGNTAIEMVVHSFLQAGIQDIRVVTGHGADELALLLEGMPVTSVHNPHYAQGMYSSVLAGFRSLPPTIQACFLLPADTPLIQHESIKGVAKAYGRGSAAVVYPTFQGRRGHPPLIGRECFSKILHSDGEGGLQTVLSLFDQRAVEVECGDRGVVLDMDTPADYEYLLRYYREEYCPAEAGAGILLGSTESLCPCCLRKIPAQRRAYDTEVYLEKECPEHGAFRTLIWQGPPDYLSWNRSRLSEKPRRFSSQSREGCPFDCGLCPEHLQQTCCVLLEVTSRCNLHCPVCFADARAGEAADPDLATVNGWYQMLMDHGGPFNIQLSGGEPTLRDDLPAVVRAGKSAGFSFIQLNTNGLRLAAEPEYTRRLKEAGLDCVFLQFDGVTDLVYETLRGRRLLAEKMAVLEICAVHGLGVVLVPTLVLGVNDGQIGDILRLAWERLPAVRGVHFQPVSYFGRYPQKPPAERLTLPRVLREIEKQTAGQMKVADFQPPGGENAYCSFNGRFTRRPDGSTQTWMAKKASCCGQPANGSQQAREYVARQWAAAPSYQKQDGATGDLKTDSLDEFLERVYTHTLAVSGMAFQDAATLDLERLRECFIHVVSPEGRLIPFCAYHLTDCQGRPLYRRPRV